MPAPLRESLIEAFSGMGAHVSPLGAIEGLTATQARKRVHHRLPTIWEQLAHIVYWQEWLLKAVRGNDPKSPKSYKGGWPPMPPVRDSVKKWASLVNHFAGDLKEAEGLARTMNLTSRIKSKSRRSYGSVLVTLADHNAYHLGQIVQLRKMMGWWPPESGGCTW
jgi:uncharacterized damage-inducible protein DinB